MNIYKYMSIKPDGIFKISSKNWNGGFNTIGRAETRWSRNRNSITTFAWRQSGGKRSTLSLRNLTAPSQRESTTLPATLSPSSHHPATDIGRYMRHRTEGRRRLSQLTPNSLLLIMEKTAALGKSVLSLMSAWMVGKTEAPAKLNMIELKAWPKSIGDFGWGCFGWKSTP